MFQNLNELKAQYAAARKQFEAATSTLLKTALVEVFKKFKTLESISWTQYTPYFNDGDACTFSVNEVSVALVGDQESRSLWDMNYAVKYESKVFEDGLLEALSALSNILTSDAFEPILKDLYGDHTEVTVTKTEIRINEYSHD